MLPVFCRTYAEEISQLPQKAGLFHLLKGADLQA